MDTRISSRELDGAIRPGLDNLKTFFTGDASPENKERAEMFLKSVRASGQRMSAENNELAMLLKFGKASGAGPEDMLPIFQSIAGRYASGQAAGVSAPALAAAKSTGSGAAKGR